MVASVATSVFPDKSACIIYNSEMENISILLFKTPKNHHIQFIFIAITYNSDFFKLICVFSLKNSATYCHVALARSKPIKLKPKIIINMKIKRGKL